MDGLRFGSYTTGQDQITSLGAFFLKLKPLRAII